MPRPLRLLPVVLALVVAACASSSGTRSGMVKNPRVYVAEMSVLQTASADALRRLRMDIVQAEPLSDGTYLIVGRRANASTRGGNSGDSEMISLQVTLEPVDGAQTRVRVSPARSGSYGGSQAARITEDFFDLLEGQGFVSLSD